MINLSVSIVNHDNRPMLDRCLASVIAHTHESHEILVVDNASPDGSADMVHDKYPGVRLICNSERKGFSANHNQALAAARGRYFVILNNDTELKPFCLDSMFAFMEKNPGAGALGPRILNPGGSLQQSVFRMPSLLVLFSNAFFLGRIFPRVRSLAGYGDWPHDALSRVPFVGGACIMFPTDLLRALGGLDERFFMYVEDADICRRVRAAGREVVFFPDAELIHYGGGAVPQQSEASVRMRLESLHAYFRKHNGRAGEALAGALVRAGAANRVVLFELARRFCAEEMREELARRQEPFRHTLAWYRGRGG